MKTPTPHISEALVNWLEETFPDRIPEIGTDCETMYRLQGSARVVRKVRHEYETQVRNSMMES